ncbi:MAG: excinuclease ABC subunit UvrB, partial [Dehalococcoidales bacterium]|nr:excinuclease ABC subunit UvrB [Dehalococcoidales bacterium]
IGKPTLVMSHNKTLAAQLYAELKEFFPDNAVEYFVSYYDYYQPESYVPSKDMYIEKEADINDEIDRLRHAATQALLTRKDVIIVSSVSCIYGLGEPEEYSAFILSIHKGETIRIKQAITKLVSMQYHRNDMELTRASFRLRGDVLEIFPANEETLIHIEFFGDEVDRITILDPFTGEMLNEVNEIMIFPAKHFVVSDDKLRVALENIREELKEQIAYFKKEGKLLEAARIEQRTNYDLEMIENVGYCSGIENYSRHLAGRPAGSAPWCLLDYFPRDFLLLVDESHMTIPQVRGMYRGDRARKETLVNYGFRLPSAIDNRPLTFDEFNDRINQVIYVSATPADYEINTSEQIVEQLIRPTGLLEPTIEIRQTKGQIDDLYSEINKRTSKGERVLVTTLTKHLAEQLSEYLIQMGIKAAYLHSEIDTFERVEILRDLRLGVYDVLIGINLLREGLDLPEVSLVAILDADKEGYLRSYSAFIQTMGRAARHENGHVIMYADKITDSMRSAIDESNRRRGIQEEYNKVHGITPHTIKKSIRDLTDRMKEENAKSREEREKASAKEEKIGDLSREEKQKLINSLEKQMKAAAKNMEFEKAAAIRDRVVELKKELLLSRLPDISQELGDEV